MYLQKPIRSLFLLLFPCFLLVLSSCQSEQESSTPSSEGQCTITFSVSNYRQISFDDLSSSAATRADTPTDHPSTLAHLLVAVFNVETGQQALQPIQHDYENYKNSPNDYSKFSLTLPYGHYRLLVLGYKGTKGCNIASINQITWEENYVPNTFLYCEEFTLDKDAILDRKITLQHAVSAFRVTAVDVIPTGIKKMRFSTDAGGTVLDAVTGFTPQNTGRTSEMVVPPDFIGKTNTHSEFTIYLFLPEEQSKGNCTVQALGESDNVLYEKHFKDVPLRVNAMTVWEGKFFETSTPDDEEYNLGFNFYWDTQWADTIKVSSF